jgi:putative holliday junction resolvase
LKRITSNGEPKTLRLLSIDPGEKRIGVAISDPLALTAQGLETITFTEQEQALERIAALCEEYKVEKLIVGNPLKLDGSRGKAVELAEELAQRLGQRTGLPVIMVDERLTSGSVEKILISGGARRKKRRAVRDKLAAALILETYLARMKRDCRVDNNETDK